VDAGPASARRLLGVFAHPDDEVFCAGGILALAAASGAETMLVSASRGERGQIRDASVATRRTLAAVREAELRSAAAELGVGTVRVLDVEDGTLPAHRPALRTAVADVMRAFDPDAVVTFAPDGGYGHPDHMAISEVTTAAFAALTGADGRRLYHAVFPPRSTSIAEELARWIVDSGQRSTGPEVLRALALFATESTTLRLARDEVRVEWFPPGIYVVEQGEPASALYLILNGTADALQEGPDGEMVHLRRMGTGDYFGELGLVGQARTAHVVAAGSLTCLVLSRTPATAYAGRGVTAVDPRESGRPEVASEPVPAGLVGVDVTAQLDRKLAALACHRTQYPIVTAMLPRDLLARLLGREFFAVA
jgi:LmbE family N-acetylglucosaminyl deacetylase